jgi:hypothetical protein
MNPQTLTLTNQFVQAMHDPLLSANREYATQFWRPYLGANAYALWDVMVSAQRLVQQGVYDRWPTVNVLAAMVGVGDRYTILGRAATRTRPAQQGTLDLLVEENLVVGWLRGDSPKGRRYTFEVQDRLPLLTPRQVKRLDTAVVKAHRRYLDRVGLLDQWSRLLHKTLAQPPGVTR